MNWKINYWTLIATIMALGLVFSCMNNEDAAKKPEWKKQINTIDQNVEKVLDIIAAKSDCDTAKITIPVTKAFQGISKFSLWMQKARKALEAANDPELLPVNFGKSPFLVMKLPKCETIRMFEAAPEGEVHLYLTLEDTPGEPGKDMISAIFSTSEFAANKGELDASAAAGSNFFDFVRPCPPACDD